MDESSPDLLRPTLTAGVVFGVLGAVPFVRLVNYCACCALVVGCGFVGSYLYSVSCRRQGAEFRPGSGATVGLVSGAFYALTATLIETVVRLVFRDRDIRTLLEWAREMPNVTAENREMIDQLLAQMEQARTTVGSLIMSFFVWVLLAAIFSTLGGLIGGAVFKRSPVSPSSAAGRGDAGVPPPSSPGV